MRNRGDEPIYRVVETPSGQFAENWTRAIELGYLNPDHSANDYEWLRSELSRNPYVGTQTVGDLWVLEYLQLGWRVRFWYHIIEDDRLVELTAVTWGLR